jgi:hypothetical protein
MNLSEALESVKIAAKANEYLISQEFFNYLYDSLKPEERSVFVTTLAEMGINTKISSESIKAFVEKDNELFDNNIEDPFTESKEKLAKQLRNSILYKKLKNV